jgi:hypothetical protein
MRAPDTRGTLSAHPSHSNPNIGEE